MDTLITCARDNILYVEAFMAQLENPTMVTEEIQVVREAQDNIRTYEELTALREMAVFWKQKKILQSDPPGSPAAVMT